MAATNFFKEAVASKDIRSTRIMMSDSLLVDPTFREFDEMKKIAGNMPGLYDKYDGQELGEDESSWDEDYMDKLMVQIIWNFSHERLNHLKKVVRYLRPVTSHTQQATSSSKSETRRTSQSSAPSSIESEYQKGKAWDKHDGNFIRIAKVSAGAVVGGAVGGTIAAVTGWSVSIGIAAGAVVAGAAVAIATNGEK